LYLHANSVIVEQQGQLNISLMAAAGTLEDVYLSVHQLLYQSRFLYGIDGLVYVHIILDLACWAYDGVCFDHCHVAPTLSADILFGQVKEGDFFIRSIQEKGKPLHFGTEALIIIAGSRLFLM